jgi:1,4-dihydroxy-2-naphthoyl-CoA hydrolase
MHTETIWFFKPGLAELNQRMQGTLLDLLNIRFTGIGDDYIEAQMSVSPDLHQPDGLVHGGAFVALAESVGSVGAFLTRDPEKFSSVGIEINANHIKSVRQGMVYATGRPLHLGKTTQVWQVEMRNDRLELVSISRMTIAIIERAVNK